MSYLNPFPVNDGPIGEDLFVGRNDVIQRFQDFLSRDPNVKHNEVWIVAGERGQGKSSLFRKLSGLAAGSSEGCALGRLTWREDRDAMFPLARKLYASIVESRQDGRRTVPLFWGGLRYHSGRLMQFASFSVPGTGGAKVSVSHLTPKPRNGAELVNLLASYLREGVRSVVLLIDEVSKTQGVSVEKTKKLADSIRDTEIPNAKRGLNILTIVFVQPKDVASFDAKNDGPRSSITLTLEDFRETDLQDLVQYGLASQKGLPPALADIAGVASAVEAWVGGVPTLSVALLHDAFEQMKRRVAKGASPVLEATDVEDCVKEGKIPQVELRINSLVKYFSMPTEVALHGNIRRLLGAFAGEAYGTGGWKETELRKKMQETLTRTTTASESIDACLRALIDAPLLLRNGEQLKFRGRLVMNRLEELLQ